MVNMLFVDVLSNVAKWPYIGLSFAFLGAAVFYARSLKIKKGITILYAGLLLLFLSSALHFAAGFFYEQGVSAKILVLSEMLLILAASSLLLMASSHILLGEPLNQNVLLQSACCWLCTPCLWPMMPILSTTCSKFCRLWA